MAHVVQALGRLLVALRWPFLVLYLLIIAYLVLLLVGNASLGGLLTIAVALGCQAAFLMARGDPRLLRPVRFHRSLVAPVIGGLMAAILLFGMGMALSELLDINGPTEPWASVLFAGSWVFWATVFLILTIRLDSFRALRRLIWLLIGGSLLQLVVTGTSHAIVIRRPGCLVGMSTGLGVAIGAAVLFWAFGPGIVLLFLHPTRRRRGHCPRCGYLLRGLPEPRCPECGRPFTFQEVGLTHEQLQNVEPDE